ncbi:hypothetical protein TNIN_433451 [Trichonephila inaurata madagascariensis]|uniref:Uncharacterized protein n=1 Tax=Trichonephila inaurata madagascariensis TaxID=2747483 RepID=A0A8X7C0S1_9ARAC|nr:hypothetical protein TNIN_433451 [Trichonephila inaurata madagascariensis]
MSMRICEGRVPREVGNTVLSPAVQSEWYQVKSQKTVTSDSSPHIYSKVMLLNVTSRSMRMSLAHSYKLCTLNTPSRLNDASPVKKTVAGKFMSTAPFCMNLCANSTCFE